MNKDRLLEKIKKNDFVQFCLIQLASILLYRILGHCSHYNNNLSYIRLIFLIINELWFFYIFWIRYRRKVLINKQGYINEVNHKKVEIIFLLKLSLIVLIYIFLNVILNHSADLKILNQTNVQHIVIIINMFLIMHVFIELLRMIISGQSGVYVPMRTIILMVGVFASVSNNILATFLISTLFLGVVNWLVSEDAFRYLQELINISTDLSISVDTKSKKLLSKVRARALFVSIAYNLSITTSESVLEHEEVRKNLSNLAIYLRISSQDNQDSQNFFCAFIVKVGFLVLYYLILKKIIDNMLRKSESYGIPIVSGILNSYNDVILKDFKNVIDDISLNEIRVKKYYVNKINEYFKIRDNSKLYVKFDKQDLFDHYISIKTYKSLDMAEKQKYYKTNKRKIDKQIAILNESLKSII